MLKTRFITAIVLISLVLGILFYGTPNLIQGTVMVFLGVGMLEWVRFYSPSKPLLVVGILFVEALYGLLTYFSAQIPLAWLSVVTAGLWVMCAYTLVRFNPFKSLLLRPMIFLGLGALLLPLSFYHLHQVFLMPQGSLGLLSLIAMVASADIGAYFTGRSCGKHRLAPLISPNKTQEGVVGGIICSVVVGAVLGAYVLEIPLFTGALLGFVLSIIAVVGDLFESALKRLYNIKDSGTLLPGHGGVLDRLDSLLPASVVFYMMMTHI